MEELTESYSDLTETSEDEDDSIETEHHQRKPISLKMFVRRRYDGNGDSTPLLHWGKIVQKSLWYNVSWTVIPIDKRLTGLNYNKYCYKKIKNIKKRFKKIKKKQKKTKKQQKNKKKQKKWNLS